MTNDFDMSPTFNRLQHQQIRALNKNVVKVNKEKKKYIALSPTTILKDQHGAQLDHRGLVADDASDECTDDDRVYD